MLYSDALPTPSGWFCVGLTRDFAKGAVTTRALAGRPIVVFRTTDGTLAALDAHCPHLGAHMGKGGRVDGDMLRCPFHGFCFDRDGTCTKAYAESKPPLARARAYPVMELHGIALVYFDAAQSEPTWRPEDVDMEEWSPFRFHEWTLRGHPQETTENSVDVGHFAIVHGYADVHELAPTTFEGFHLRAQYGFDRPTRVLGKRFYVREAIDVHVWGLGYSRVHVSDLSWGLDLRLLVLPTPTDADRIDLRIGLSVRHFSKMRRVPALFRLLPRAASGLVARALLRVYRREIEQDFEIWQNKKYVVSPPLARGDGPVGHYRRWAKQFYEGDRTEISAVSSSTLRDRA